MSQAETEGKNRAIEENNLQFLAAGEGSQLQPHELVVIQSNSYLRGKIADEQVSYDPRIVMLFTANPTTVNAGGSSTLTADLRYDN